MNLQQPIEATFDCLSFRRRSFSAALQVTRSHLTYFSITLKNYKSRPPPRTHTHTPAPILSNKQSRQKLQLQSASWAKALLQYSASLNIVNFMRNKKKLKKKLQHNPASLEFPCSVGSRLAGIRQESNRRGWENRKAGDGVHVWTTRVVCLCECVVHCRAAADGGSWAPRHLFETLFFPSSKTGGLCALLWVFVFFFFNVGTALRRTPRKVFFGYPK